MKNKIIFTNIIEDRFENFEAKLRKLIFEMLGIEHNIQFGNIQRFGKRTNGRPRPIVARFIYHTDLSMVLDNANRLKKHPYWHSSTVPQYYRTARKKLYPVEKEAKRNGQHTVLVHDRLFINGVLYQCDDNMGELHQTNDTRNESRPAYRDALLTTTPKESQRPYQRQRYGSSPINDSRPSNST